jgi:hypothetical protein
MELWIGFTACVVIELRHEEPGCPLARGSASAASCPAGGAFKMRRCRQHSRSMGLLDHLPVMGCGESP